MRKNIPMSQQPSDTSLVEEILVIPSLMFLLLLSSSWRDERYERLFVSFRFNNC